MALNYIRIFRIMRALRRDAQSYRTDDVRSGQLAEQALVKAEKNRGALAKVWDDLASMIRLLKAYAGGRYRKLPWRSVSLSIAALLYFISPLDAVPDFLPALGLLDDAFIVTWVMRTIQKDLDRFRQWEDSAA